MEKQKYIAVYIRVSSAAQNLELQKEAANRYLESQGLTGDEDFVLFFIDKDVSATKLSMENRTELMKMLEMAKENKLKQIICYKRDRIQRNFYESAVINRIFIDNDIEITYTASNEPLFSNKLSLEAFYGIFGQKEGENIGARTSDARKQYPSKLYGYTRIKEKDQVRFVIDETKRGSIEKLFNDFSKIQNENEFFNFLKDRKKEEIKDPNKILKIIENAFYAGHFKATHSYQLLSHVEPIIDLELFVAANKVLESFVTRYQNKVLEVKKNHQAIPLCGICGNPMKHRKENVFDSGYYVCRASHKRIAINSEVLGDLVDKAVLDHVKEITIKKFKRLSQDGIKRKNNELVRNQNLISNKYLELSLQVCTLNPANNSKRQDMINQLKALKKEYNKIGNDLTSLSVLRHEFKEIEELALSVDYNFSDHNLLRLTELLVNEIHVHETYVGIELFLSKFAKDVEVS
ncbi:putative DNA recombinase [Lentibacillus populi]|uniref:DNA recombinase n=1 Tax=Lentibacillus populi TaxID=1827502 RepID=A0A9W5U217_9BACI|nr:recombinase family protein [Lentibacillus populi]GGB62265.1 putative DNA recombinase [Lentibacillus populi]